MYEQDEKNSQKTRWLTPPPKAPPPLRLRHRRTQMFYKQTAYFPLNNVKHLHKGTQMSRWLTIESVPEQPITEPLNPTYAWLIHQTTSILLPLPLVRECARHARTHAAPARADKPTNARTRRQTQCAQNPYRTAHEHTDAAPSIMVNTSNSISFLDSWSLDRHGSDSPWFLTGCLAPSLPPSPPPPPPPPPPFFFPLHSLLVGSHNAAPNNLFPMKSVWVVTEHAAKTDSLTYYLFFSCKLV